MIRPLSLPLPLLRCPAPARLSRPPPPPPPPPQGTQAPGNCRLLRAHGRPQRHRRRSSSSASLSVSGPEMDPAARKDLYPHVEPFDTGRLRVSDVHTIYYEQSGNPGGHPVVFLHGGPGAGTSPGNRRFFDPEFYRIVLFDQRGAGKSTPHACLEQNTTWDLVADIEKLRQHLDIPEWQVFGGSWGSTLALAYSQTHPDKVTGIVLRGIFLLRKKELDWFYEGGAAAVFPDAWEPFRDFIPEDERNCFIAAYSKRLTSSDADVQIEAAKRWTTWEMMTAHLLQNHENIKRGEDDKFSLAFARIENHYFINKGFLDSDSHLLDNVDKIRHIKSFIVQGRYDMCCPMMSAWDLHKAWPEAEFKVVPDAGHSANEVGVAAELVSANEKLKGMLKK
ncbi:hypothetical protein CFC21_013113 [Triticum aestivum]|uniref:Proline iminopeptidase n=5 Tax=Triticinae TaxID=1648030 RepID=A0A9R1DRH3_WHEAT|nr:proline iminopeptidase-like [Triticum aestivum]KAF6996816.1 hypothetical protein CFC21_013111 [Triticum aestivum]KAF6996818.1 hypothetical protein CFC21_013113 [Triticum aestivum]